MIDFTVFLGHSLRNGLDIINSLLDFINGGLVSLGQAGNFFFKLGHLLFIKVFVHLHFDHFLWSDLIIFIEVGILFK